MSDERDSLTLNFKRILLDPGIPPKPAQRFFWTRVGPDFQLEIGYFDLPELRTALEEARTAANKESKAVVHFNVTDRFMLTLANVIELSRAADGMMADVTKTMKAAGVTDLGALASFKMEEGKK